MGRRAVQKVGQVAQLVPQCAHIACDVLVLLPSDVSQAAQLVRQVLESDALRARRAVRRHGVEH
jgi:hypothetical protein